MKGGRAISSNLFIWVNWPAYNPAKIVKNWKRRKSDSFEFIHWVDWRPLAIRPNYRRIKTRFYFCINLEFIRSNPEIKIKFLSDKFCHFFCQNQNSGSVKFFIVKSQNNSNDRNFGREARDWRVREISLEILLEFYHYKIFTYASEIGCGGSYITSKI